MVKLLRVAAAISWAAMAFAAPMAPTDATANNGTIAAPATNATAPAIEPPKAANSTVAVPPVAANSTVTGTPAAANATVAETPAADNSTAAAAPAVQNSSVPVTVAGNSTSGVVAKEGECKEYVQGNAKLALCLEKVTQVTDGIVQVDGFLVNNGEVPVCDLSLAAVHASDATVFWPDWAKDSKYELDFQKGQVTNVGLTMPPFKEDEAPGFELTGFRDCTEAKGEAFKPHITDAKVDDIKKQFKPQGLSKKLLRA